MNEKTLELAMQMYIECAPEIIGPRGTSAAAAAKKCLEAAEVFLREAGIKEKDKESE
jgi:hypothetical protein